jgi:hypothetical protein
MSPPLAVGPPHTPRGLHSDAPARDWDRLESRSRPLMVGDRAVSVLLVIRRLAGKVSPQCAEDEGTRSCSPDASTGPGTGCTWTAPQVVHSDCFGAA